MSRVRTRPLTIVKALAAGWRTLTHRLFDAYHPERHYMRGPGPKWHAKHGIAEAAEPESKPVTAVLLAPVRL